jgi:competence protein ComEA
MLRSRPDSTGRVPARRARPCRLSKLAIALCFLITTMTSGTRSRAGGRNLDGVINLNTAPPELLILLPGIGPAKARGIEAYRLRRPFRTVDELVRVKGIGRRMVREIRSHLAVAGPSTAHGLPGPRLPEPVQIATPRPIAPPSLSSIRIACRPTAQPLGKIPPVHSHGPQAHPIRSPANHCAPPS